MKNPQKSPVGTFKVVRRRMNINPILGFFFVMNCLATRVAPLGDTNTIQKRYFFILLAQQEPPGTALIPLGAKL